MMMLTEESLSRFNETIENNHPVTRETSAMNSSISEHDFSDLPGKPLVLLMMISLIGMVVFIGLVSFKAFR